jgi:hypothetical protein
MVTWPSCFLDLGWPSTHGSLGLGWHSTHLVEEDRSPPGGQKAKREQEKRIRVPKSPWGHTPNNLTSIHKDPHKGSTTSWERHRLGTKPSPHGPFKVQTIKNCVLVSFGLYMCVWNQFLPPWASVSLVIKKEIAAACWTIGCCPWDKVKEAISKVCDSGKVLGRH